MQDNYLKIAAVGALVLLALAGVGAAFQYKRMVDKTYPMRTFSVDGSGEIETVPDVASFSVTVVTEGGTDVAAVQAENTEKMNTVSAFVKGEGVEEKDLKTVSYELSPKYTTIQCVAGDCPAPSITGYTLNQTLEVKVRDAEKLGALLSGVVEQGANSVSDVRFVVDDDTDAKNEARKEAITAAKEKAKNTAKLAGFRLGKIVSIYENSGDEPMPYGAGGDMMEMSALKTAVAPDIERGTSETEVRVTINYEIAE